MDKKGDIVSGQVIIIIIIIASAVLVILSIKGLFFDSDIINQKACETSVLARDLANTEIIQGAKYLPLKCVTEKICLGRNDCSSNFLETKNSPITKIDLTTTNKDEIKKAILDVYTLALADCHTMLGSGRADFFPAGYLENDYCVVCSRIALGDSVKKNFNDKIGFFDLYNNMESTTFEGKSYLELVYGLKTSGQIVADYNQIIDKIKSEEIDSKNINVKLLKTSLESFDPAEEQAIVVRVTKEGKVLSLVSAGVSAGGALAISGYLLSVTGVGLIIGIPLAIVGTTATAGVTYVSVFENSFAYYHPSIVLYDIEVLNSLNCDLFENLP